MNVVILCGGRGMRLNGGLTPKALAEVKEQPMVEHVMDVYEPAGRWKPKETGGLGRDRVGFYLLLGSLSDTIRLHFLINPRDRCDLLDTGRETGTGGRLRQWISSMHKWCGDQFKGPFCVAYCDCLADIDIDALLAYHRLHGKLATLTAVPAISSKGVLGLEREFRHEGNEHTWDAWRVGSFNEKPRTTDWVNFGYFVFEPGVAEYLTDGMLEEEALPRLAAAGQLMAYRHNGWYMSVDSPKELEAINAVEGTPWLRAK